MDMVHIGYDEDGMVLVTIKMTQEEFEATKVAAEKEMENESDKTDG